MTLEDAQKSFEAYQGDHEVPSGWVRVRVRVRIRVRVRVRVRFRSMSRSRLKVRVRVLLWKPLNSVASANPSLTTHGSVMNRCNSHFRPCTRTDLTR